MKRILAAVAVLLWWASSALAQPVCNPTINTPAPGSTVSGTITLTMTPACNSGVLGTDFFIKWWTPTAPGNSGIVNSSTSFTYDTTQANNGQQGFLAQVTNAAGTVVYGAGTIVNYTFANPTGTITCSPVITAPPNNSSQSGTITLTMSPNCNTGVVGTNWVFKWWTPTTPATGPPLSSATSITFNTATAPNGTQGFLVQVVDPTGATTYGQSTISNYTVQNGSGGPPPPGDPLPPNDPGMQWLQTYGDEFNGTTVDTTKWNGLYGGTPNPPPWCMGCQQNYSGLVEGGGVLTMQGNPNAPVGINSYGKFQQRYGYFSARVQNAQDDGSTWAAGLWAFAVAHGPAPTLPCAEGYEEFDGDESGYAVPGTSDFATSDTLHDFCYNGPLVNGAANSYQYPNNGINLSQGFHVYGWQWRNDGSLHGTFQGFMDGNAVTPVMPTDPKSNQWDTGLYLLSGMQKSSTGHNMQIDWIHAYQQVAGSGQTPTPTPTPTATPTPTGSPSATATPSLFGNVLRSRDVWQSFGVITKNVADCGGPQTVNVYANQPACQGTDNSIMNANILAYLGFTLWREDATHLDTGALWVVDKMAKMLTSYFGVPSQGTELASTDAPGGTVGETPASCPAPPNVYCGSYLDEYHNQLFLAQKGDLRAVEYPNEIDNNNFSYFSVVDGVTYTCHGTSGDATGCARYEAEIYRLIKSDATLGSFRVIGLSHPGGEGSDACVQDLTCAHTGAEEPIGTVNADVANAHNYYQSDGTPCPIDNWTFDGETLAFNAGQALVQGEYWAGPGIGTWAHSFPIDGGLTQLPTQSGWFPRVTTETGANVFNCGSLTRDIQGKTQVNVLADGIIQGWGDTQSGISTYIYQAIEHGPSDSGMGMVVPDSSLNNIFNPSLVNNPSFLLPGGGYMHNFMRLIADTGSNNYTPVFPAGFSVTGLGTLGHTQLLQKSNGQYVLLLWGEAYQTETVTNASVTLPAGVTAAMYDVTSAVQPGDSPPLPINSSVTGTTVVPLTDHMRVITWGGVIIPPTPTPTGTPTPTPTNAGTPTPTATRTPTATPTGSAPFVMITSPVNQSTVSGTISLTATNQPSTDYLKWYGPSLGSGCPAPLNVEAPNCVTYTGANSGFSFDTTQLANGPSGFFVQEFPTPTLPADASATVNFTIQNSFPTPTLTPTPTPTATPGTIACFPAIITPAPGSTINGAVSLTVAPACSSGAQGVDWFVRWYTPTGNVDNGTIISFDTNTVKNGVVSFQVQIFNVPSGNIIYGTSTAVTYTVANGVVQGNQPSPGTAAALLYITSADLRIVSDQSAYGPDTPTAEANARTMLQYLGVPHVRSDFTCDNSIFPGCDPRNLISTFLNTFPADYWVLLPYTAGSRASADLLSFDMPNLAQYGNTIHALEVGNEVNNIGSGFTYNGLPCGDGNSDWTGCAAFAADFYTDAKNQFPNMPIFSWTNPFNEPNNVKLQYVGAGTPGGSPKLADYADVHNYPNVTGTIPDFTVTTAFELGSGGPDNGMTGNFCGTTVTGGFPTFGTTPTLCATIPRVVTETGMEFSKVTEEQKASIVVNEYVIGYIRGWSLVSIYAVADDTTGFGLFASGITSPTASSFAIHNFETILNDPIGAPFNANTACPTITGNVAPTDYVVCGQFYNGNRFLVATGDRASGKAVETWNLAGVPANAKIYDVNQGSTPVAIGNNINVDDHVIIVTWGQSSTPPPLAGPLGFHRGQIW